MEMSPVWPIGIVGQNQQFVASRPIWISSTNLASITGVCHVYDPGLFRYLFGGTPSPDSSKDGHRVRAVSCAARMFCPSCGTWWQDTVGPGLYGAMAFGVPCFVRGT